MPKTELFHNFYMACQDVDLNESFELITEAKTPEEADFIRVVTDLILQQKQEKAIYENRF